MPLDPIHTIRAAKRLHLKDAIFVSWAPVSVAAGHLRAVGGRVSWVGPASAVERGEEVLECWRQVVLPGLAIGGLHPLRYALRGFSNINDTTFKKIDGALSDEDYKNCARQLFVECAGLGVLAPIVSLTGESPARLRATVGAAAEVGLRTIVVWNGGPAEAAAILNESDTNDRIRIIHKLDSPNVTIAGAVGGRDVDARSILSAAPAALPDALSLVRALEGRRAGLGFECLQSTFAVFEQTFGAPFGSFKVNSFFDTLFLDYEVPGLLTNENIKNWILNGFSTSQIEAAAVATNPVVRRHEVLTADRAAVAQAVRSSIGRAVATL